MKVRLLLTIALFTFAASTPQAQVTIDVAKLTCEQLFMEKLAWPSKYAVLWLNGTTTASAATRSSIPL
jgi:hypothetical protein